MTPLTTMEQKNGLNDGDGGRGGGILPDVPSNTTASTGGRRRRPIDHLYMAEQPSQLPR